MLVSSVSSSTPSGLPRLPAIGTRAPDVSLLEASGERISLATLWQKRPTLLFFMRHAGCALCRAHLWALRSAAPQIIARGGQIAAIALEYGGFTPDFLDRRRIAFPLLFDPDQTAYHAFGLTHGSLAEVGGASVLLAQAAQALQGNLPYVWPGAPIYQLGGSFIVDRQGVVRFTHVTRPINQHPTIETYLAVFDALATAAT